MKKKTNKLVELLAFRILVGATQAMKAIVRSRVEFDSRNAGIDEDEIYRNQGINFRI